MSQAMKRFPYATFAAAIVIFYGCREQERTAGVSAAKSSKLNGAPVDENPANDWVVSFDDGALPNARMLCSGILITPNRVLTSAHCLFPESGGDPNNPVPTKVADTFNVRFGPHFDDPTQLRVTASPKNIVVHPNALPNIVDNYDLAIFKLDRRVGVTTSEQHIIPRRPQIFTPPDAPATTWSRRTRTSMPSWRTTMT